MGDITWTLPSDVVSDHKFNVVIDLIEAGIKLFLNQRNQIPVPVEHLSREVQQQVQVPTVPNRSTHRPTTGTSNVAPLNENVPHKADEVRIGNQPQAAASKLPPDYVDPRIKIRSLVRFTLEIHVINFQYLTNGLNF